MMYSEGQACIFDPDTESVVIMFRNAAVSNNAWYYVEKNRISNGTRGGFVGISDAAYTAMDKLQQLLLLEQ